MFRRLGRAIEYLSDSPLTTGIASAVVILFFGGLEFSLHLGLPSIGVPRLLEAAINATFVGCFAGLATWVILRAIRDRRMKRMEELRKIAELNHEVRNALEVIADCHFAADPEHRDLVLESVARVSRVLKKVFPPRAA